MNEEQTEFLQLLSIWKPPYEMIIEITSMFEDETFKVARDYSHIIIRSYHYILDAETPKPEMMEHWLNSTAHLIKSYKELKSLCSIPRKYKEHN